MKVLLHYEDNDNTELHKSLKITLPKSWKSGPTSKLLGQFVESYNANETLGSANPLSEESLHLSIRRVDPNDSDQSSLEPLASNAVVLDVIADRADVYIAHGASQTLEQIDAARQEEIDRKRKEQESTTQCTRLGCPNRFPKGGPYPSQCRHHVAPPVFHETAKFWSCCPNKKAYDFEEFQAIPGCSESACCTDVKETIGNGSGDAKQPQFLGGMDLREATSGATKLKSIDDFNTAQAAGGSEAAPVLERLQVVLGELDIDKELFQQVIEGLKKEALASGTTGEAELLQAVKNELGEKIKTTLKGMAAAQLRIK